MLDDAAIAHSRDVAIHVGNVIAAAGGWIPFERFMDLALYAPGLGYYSAGTAKFGAAGDFVTAPEISRLFGAGLSVPCAQVLEHLGGGSILEIGAGSGRLACDMLGALRRRGRLPERYFILDVSADLRERQHATLHAAAPEFLERVQWIDTPPHSFEGVVLANEVLDALPVTRFRWYADRVEECGVIADDDGLAWESRPASADLTRRVTELARGLGWDDGYRSELCPRLGAWVEAVTGKMTRGAVLWVDYGLPRPQFYHPDRRAGTLLCHLQHRVHDNPLRYPGIQDITAWVDFTAVAAAGRAAGFELGGFTTQAHFLLDTGIELEMQRLASDDSVAFARLAGEARRLLLPGEMGERFKVMSWLRGIDLELRGFAHADLRYSL